MVTPGSIRGVLVDFLGELDDRLDSPHRVEDVLRGEETLSSADLGQRPETFVENELIYPLLLATENRYDEQPFGEAGGRVVWPDFVIKNLSSTTIGENKALNLVDKAESEIKEYLDRKSIGADYGLITDGIEWRIYKIELGGDVTEYPTVLEIDLRPVLAEIAREEGIVGSTSIGEVDVADRIGEFVDSFTNEELETLLSETAPRKIRDERKRDVEEFYELYIELLFGESDEYDYETSLMDDIRPPMGASEYQERLFAVTLMNRLLFIKFLESRDILDEGFLRERVDHYEKYSTAFAGNLYETQIKPLFYKLLNTPLSERDPKYRTGWFADVPYLNGGLFRENVKNEHQFTVADRVLPIIVSDLIEGSELELNGGGFDPAVLGSVFEKTITHIEAEREQKDRGAYYTPNDVTNLVNKQSVDPKIKDEIIESFVDVEASDEEEEDFLRGRMEDKSLAELLRRIEEGEGFYSSPDGIESAVGSLTELKVIDPACGSGHFLTSAMDEIFRAQLSLLRGLNRGEDPPAEEKYEVKKDLALRAIYGVDVDEIATEIAKLRVWLKIVEGNSWEPGFGKLPNIDVNITPGNTLIGLPVKGLVESVGIWDENIEEYADMRRRYKHDDIGDPRDIHEFYMEEIHPRLNQAFLDRLTHYYETEVTEAEEFQRVLDSVDDTTLYPTIESVKAVREDGDALTDDDEERLTEVGFNTYTKSARLDIENREHELKNAGTDGVRDVVGNELTTLLDEGFEFEEVVRQPVGEDLDNVLGRPFHWPVEFPEVSVEEGSEHTIHFDLVLGNPPYGDIMSESENALTDTYIMSGTDVAAPFVERQIQLLTDDGYFGNVTTAKLLYKQEMEPMQDIWRENLDTIRVAAFGKRPSKVFQGAEVRVSIITGRKDTETRGEIRTSEFIRFDNKKDRESRFKEIEYRPVDGLTLHKDGIDGDEKHVAIPKVGLHHIESILHTLREYDIDSLIGEREVESATDHVMWRREGGDYFINPMLDKLYNAREVKPFYFDSELEARAAFLGVSSSIFYIYWTVYGDMFHLNLSEVRAYPLPSVDVLEEHRDDIMNISKRLWETMDDGFDESRNEFANYEQQMPIIREADALFGEMYDLDEETVEFAQFYHSEYGRHGPDNSSIDEY